MRMEHSARGECGERRVTDGLGGRRVYRTRDPLFGAAVMGAVAVAWAVAALVPAFASHKLQVAGYVWAPLFVLGTWRTLKVGVHVSNDGVKVTGFLASKRVAWPEIARFEVSPAGRYPYVGHVIRNNGRPPIVVLGINTARGKTEKHRLQAQRQVDGLNKELADWRARHPAKVQDDTTV